MTTINIVGTGNVAWHLATALAAIDDVTLLHIAGRDKEQLLTFKSLAQACVYIDKLGAADVTIIAVSDDSIAAVYEQLPFTDALVVHTSGFTGMLSRKRTKNRTGVFYPLQSFSKSDTTIDFKNIPILLEAENIKDEKLLHFLAESLSQNVQIVSSEKRRSLHLAAVFANNFTNYCYSIAQDICDENEISFDTLHPLILKTAEKALTNGPQSSQTGPAKRNDTNVIKTQEKLLTKDTHIAVYKSLTKALQTTYGKKL